LFCGAGLSPIFLALGKNRGLKTLTVNWFGLTDESLCTAIQNGLGTNATLEHLKLHDVCLRDDNFDLSCKALSFLLTNKALKSLEVDVRCATESCLSAFRIDIAAMLQENTSLESLSILCSCFQLKAEEYIALVTSLQQNTTLKILQLNDHEGFYLTHDENKHVAALLKKNFALERLPAINLEYHLGDVGAILRLNTAGRRYLVQEGSSISKDVEVLSRVNNDINCVLLHLLENPRLCDRRAVETVSAGNLVDESDSH
jgi:hypothetical protein